jgi:hypothetical protein
MYGNEVKRISNIPQGSKLTTILKLVALVHQSTPALLFNLPFNMLLYLEVHHVISNDVNKVHNFSHLFGIRETPSELIAKVKASSSSLHMFPVAEEAAKESFLAINWIICVPYSKAIDAKL